MDDLADAGSGGYGREKDSHLLGGGGNGGLQIERDEHGKRGALRLGAADVELAAMTRVEQLPVRRGALLIRNGHGTHGMPQLAERAQHGGFRDFTTEALAQLDGGKRAFALENGVCFRGERGHARGADSGGRTLGAALWLECVEMREGFRSGEKIGLLTRHAGRRAEKIQGNRSAGCDEAREHLRCSSDLVRCGSDVAAARYGFDEAGRGDRQVLIPRKKKAEGRVPKPALGVVERKKRVAILTPACLPRFFQLILFHEFRS